MLKTEEWMLQCHGRIISSNKSKIVDLFQAQFRTDITCLQCKKHSFKFGVYSYLSLPINKLPKKSFVIDIFHRRIFQLFY